MTTSKRALARFRRSRLALAMAGILMLSASVLPSSAWADRYWDMEVKAKAAVDAGNPAAAVPYWIELVQHSQDTGSWTNAALYAKSLGQYYDSAGDYPNAIRYYELENDFWLKDGKDWGAADTYRAEQIRTTIDIYVSTNDAQDAAQLAAPVSGGLAKFEPESGMYIGMYSEQDPQMGNNFTRSQSIYGKNHALYLAYTPYGAEFPTRYADNARQAGAGLQLGFEPSGGLDQVNDTDGYLRRWARAAKASGIPIFLRYASEMNGAWTIWHGDPAKYIEKFRLVAKVMKEEAPNVAMVWSPGDVPKYSMSAYYPGDDVVDWVGISLYTEPYGNGNPADPMLGTSPVERLDELYSLYSARKPIMISETAVSHKANRTGESFTDWAVMNLDRLYRIMPIKYPRLKAITYFNVDLKAKESQNDYLLLDNPAMFQAYKDIIAEPFYLSKIEQGAKPAIPVGYRKAAGSAVFAKQTRIAPFVKIPDVMIGRVDFLLNGAVAASQTKPPYRLDLNAGSVYDGSSLEIRVYNTSGKLAGSRTIGLSSSVSVAIDGVDQRFEQPPVIREGNTLAPMRAIFEALGATVSWDQATMTATGRKGSTVITFQIGNRNATVNGQPVMLEMPAQLINNSTMAPARFIGEAFGGKVDWDGTTRTVRIASKG